MSSETETETETGVAIFRRPDRWLPLFAYGRLADATFAEHLLGHSVRAETAALVDHSSVDLDGSGFPLLVPSPGDCFDGTLLSVTPTDFQALDAYAGVGEGLYERVEAEARQETGERRTVYVYLATRRRGNATRDFSPCSETET